MQGLTFWKRHGECGKGVIMAERRMFAKSIIDSDSFIDMPTSARLLYFDLAMRADDDGFVDSPKKIQRMTGAKPEDMKTLIENQYVIPFDSGIVVIKHWRIHNYIQKDRYKPTIHQNEKKTLLQSRNNVYTLDESECIQDVSNLDTQVRLGKDRLGKDRLGEGSVVESDTPSRDEIISFIKAYCEEHNCSWLIRKADHYAGYANGDWKRNIIDMIEKDAKEPPKSKAVNFTQSNTDWDDAAHKIIEQQQAKSEPEELSFQG